MKLSAAQLRRAVPHGKPRMMFMGGASVTFYAQVRTVSESNARGHWRKRHNRTKAQQEAVALAMRGIPIPSLPVQVKLTRIATRALDVGDNLPAALKAVRDQVAKEYGVDDGGDSIVWDYDQLVTVKVPTCVRIHICPVEEAVKLAQRQAKHFAGKKCRRA